MSAANVAVSYLRPRGAVIADTATNYAAIRYVQVRIVGYTQQMLIPFVRAVVSDAFVHSDIAYRKSWLFAHRASVPSL